MRKVLFILAMLPCTVVGWAQNKVDYWFDQQAEKAAYTSGEIDCSALSTGVHFVHFQIKDADGKACPVQSKAFLLLNENVEVSSAYSAINYWFDQQTEKAAYTSGDIDCSALSTGVHFVHFQIKDADGKASPVQSKAFLLINENLETSSDYSTINYWFDQQTEKTAYTSGSIDCSALSVGLHAIHFQLIDKNGKPTPVRSHFFLTLNSETPRLCYWFDDSITRNVMDIDETEINVESLSNGHHTLHALLVDEHGHATGTEIMTANFTIVCPEGEHVDANGDGVCDLCDEQFSTGIKPIEKESESIHYNLSGIRIPSGTKGIIIVNGKKILNK